MSLNDETTTNRNQNAINKITVSKKTKKKKQIKNPQPQTHSYGECAVSVESVDPAGHAAGGAALDLALAGLLEDEKGVGMEIWRGEKSKRCDGHEV